MINLRSPAVLCARLPAIRAPRNGRATAGHHAGRLRHPGWQKHWQSSIKRKPQGTARSAQGPEHRGKKNKKSKSVAEASASNGKNSSVASVVKELKGAAKRPMPTAIHPMLAISIEKPFDNPEYLFEIKWDGYRAVSFIKDGSVRLVTRNENDLTGQYQELHQLPKFVKAITAILDGEVVALDEQGRASFSLMQQRTGMREHGRRAAPRPDIAIRYYLFDLIWIDGVDLRRVSLLDRKQALASVVKANELVKYSDHF